MSQPRDGWVVHSQAHAQSFRRDAVRPVSGEPVFSELLRRSGIPPRDAVRSLVVNALATATGRGADCHAAAGEPFGGASDRGDREQRSRARGGGHHRAGEGDRASDRCAAHPPGDRGSSSRWPKARASSYAKVICAWPNARPLWWGASAASPSIPLRKSTGFVATRTRIGPGGISIPPLMSRPTEPRATVDHNVHTILDPNRTAIVH
jgi:hypothetical protein